MMPPAYFDIKRNMIKTVGEEDATSRIISGNYNGVEGVNTKYVQVRIFDISLKPDKEVKIDIADELLLFAYFFEGDGYFGDGEHVENITVAIFGEGDTFNGRSGTEGLIFILFAGKPLNEPVAWGGFNSNE
jgi:redox-sensitive bicupin YhaK (pirin superfamily)